VDGSSVVVVAPSGELDVSRVAEVDAMLDIVPPDGRLIVDLSAVAFVDSVTLSRFVRALRRAEAGGGRLVLADARGPVRRILAITRLDAVIPYVDDVELAHEYLRAVR
jgi:anti-anti-sigma factor